MKEMVLECNPPYSLVKHDDMNYTLGWHYDHEGLYSNLQKEEMTLLESAFKYYSAFDLMGFPIGGSVSTYSGGGYVAEMGTNAYKAGLFIEELKQNNWINYYTRAVVLEFNVYNPNVNLFGYFYYLMEFPATGGVLTMAKSTLYQVKGLP